MGDHLAFTYTQTWGQNTGSEFVETAHSFGGRHGRHRWRENSHMGLLSAFVFIYFETKKKNQYDIKIAILCHIK